MQSEQETPRASTTSKEILSPEGVEERVEFEITFRVTLTQGGKLRVYVVEQGKTSSVKILDTMEEAKKSLGIGMTIHGALLVDPEKAIKRMLDSMK